MTCNQGILKSYVSFSESISPSNTNCKDTQLLQYCQKAFLSPLGYLFHLTYAKSNQTQDKSSSNFRNFHQIRAKYIRGIAKLKTCQLISVLQLNLVFSTSLLIYSENVKLVI